jgi:threonine dehydratase
MLSAPHTAGSHTAVAAVSLASIEAARTHLAGVSVPTPLLRCELAADREVFLKLENLQPTGSFKVRPVGSILGGRSARSLGDGVYTLSSGNSSLALAWLARRLGIPATAVVNIGAPEAKLARLRGLGAHIVPVPFETWWRGVEQRSHPGVAGEYIDAVRDARALAGDGTLGLEILTALRELDAIFVPFGGGGLACGIACAVRALRPEVAVIACELESAQPLGAALRAGHVVVTESRSGFVSGVGFNALLPEMWPLARQMLTGSLSVSLEETARAIRLLAQEHQVIAEGAGALPVAAALWGRHSYRRVCAVVSGGNLGHDVLAAILAGSLPS